MAENNNAPSASPAGAPTLDDCVDAFEKAACKQTYQMRAGVKAVMDMCAAPANAEEDAYVIDRLGKLLAGVAIALKGPDLAQHRHSYHDLVEVAEKMVLELDLYRAAYSNKSPTEASASPAALTVSQALLDKFKAATRATNPIAVMTLVDEANDLLAASPADQVDSKEK